MSTVQTQTTAHPAVELSRNLPEVDSHEQAGPFTPLTPNGPAQSWRPKELNLVRRRQASASASTEPSALPFPQATALWSATPTISAERNALLVGLGLGGVDLDPASSASVPTSARSFPADNSKQTTQPSVLSRSKSPQLRPSVASSRDDHVLSNTAVAGAQQGPKQLLLVSSGGPPSTRRFNGRRPSEALLESFTSPTPPCPPSEASSRCTTPQMRCAIPVKPSGPAFVANRALSPDVASAASTDKQAGLSAEEFLAQIASTPEYQASEYLESTAYAFTCHDHAEASEPRPDDTPTLTASPASSVLTAKAQGFSSMQRSRAASLNKRKQPPAPLLLTSSPATSTCDTLAGSPASRRRSITATANPKSPLSSSPHSAPPAAATPASASSASSDRRKQSSSDYDQPLHTPYCDFDMDDDDGEQDHVSELGSASYACQTTHGSNSVDSAQSGRAAILGCNISDSSASRHSAMSSRIASLRSQPQDRQSSGSTTSAAPAFEFDDLETESNSDGLSMQTMMGFLQRQNSYQASRPSSEDGNEQGAQHAADTTITQEPRSEQSGPSSPRTAVSPTAKVDASAASPTPVSAAASGMPSFNVSIFGPSQSSETPLVRKNGVRKAQGGSAPSSPDAPVPPSRKQSMVPAPPSFAFHGASRVEEQLATPGMLLPALADGIEARPAVMERTSSNDLGNSRWSSGSESDGEAASSIMGARKSFSKGRKSFSSNRKNSVPFARESTATPTSPTSSAAEGAGRKGSRRSSKTRLSGSTLAASGSAIAQTQPAPSKPSMSKRLLLSGLPLSLRKKSFSNLSSHSTSPATPTLVREPVSAGPSYSAATEFPFPPSAPPQITSTPPLPSTSAQNSERAAPPQLSIRTAFAPTFGPSAQPIQTPRTPNSASGIASSTTSGPLTTQQILAQARNNVWPENYIGTGVSAAGLSSPYLCAAQDTFNQSYVPSRLAPTPPYSASASRLGWSSAPHTSPIPQSPYFAATTSQDKSLPGTPLDEIPSMSRSRSRTAEIAPPKNLRHIRQSSSNTSLGKMPKDLPADLFRPSQPHVAAPNPSSAIAVAPPRSDVSVAGQEKVSVDSQLSSQSAASGEKSPQVLALERFLPLVPVLVKRKQAKRKKARRVRRQNDRFPRHNSWSEFGLQWIAEQGDDAFDRLAAEGLPSTAILAAAGAPPKRSNQVQAAGGGRGGGGDDDSDGSDTDDYGSSDGGGGAGGFGGAGGAGGGKRPGAGGDDAGNSDDDDDDEQDSEEDDDAEAMTDEDSEDDYGVVESSAAARSRRAGAIPAVPNRSASIPATAAQGQDAADSDSSDDRPLGQLVEDPRALQKALRAKERKRHFDLAAQALEGKGSSNAVRSTSSQSRRAMQPQDQGQATDAAVNPNDLSHRLAKVQGRRERAQAPNAGLMQRSHTVARQDQGRSADSVSRSKSVRTAPAERYVHPGMRARTPSEAALRAKAMAQAIPHGSNPISPTLPGMAKMPELPSNAMATVVAAQKAMAHAQANPTPAALAQAQALANSATAALNAATAQVKRNGSSPISPSFSVGEPAGQGTTSPRLIDGAEFPGARHRANSRAHALPNTSTSGAGVVAPAHQPGVLQRLRSRSVSRNQAALTINTAAAQPMLDLHRPGTASKDSQASGSPHSTHATFAALSQAAMYHGRPSVDSSAAHGDAQMQRAPSALPSNGPSSQEGSSAQGAATADPRQPHKVFILSRQRFTVVEVPVSARARDLALEVIERERLPMDDSKGGWVVFDCSAQLGIERPLREYEVITDVVNVRAHPRTDFFLIKRTELSPYLSIRSVPGSSPAIAGWVYVQDRKKKWNKRWLELRDHGLYHAKNEKGKDETAICQISTFDVYLVDSAAIKMPKANGFALRSQDPITMFEKPEQDYMHYFCLTDPAAHRDWVRSILNARTYILRQEKAVLFQIDSPPSSQDVAAGGVMASGGLSRKNTSRRPNGRPAGGSTDIGSTSAIGPLPPTPLIDSNAFAGPFAKGSLLADKAISDAKEALRGHTAVAPPTGAFNDLSLMDRNAARANEARRREEHIERQRRMKADGQPLIDLARK